METNCTMCGRTITESMGVYKILKPTQFGTRKEEQVCGQCYILVNIKDTVIRLLTLVSKQELN